MAGIVMLMLMPLFVNAHLPLADTTAPGNPQKLPDFKNAYGIAQELANVYRPGDTTGIINILAGLAWYAAVQKPEDLPEKIKASEYGVLGRKVEALLNNIVNPDIIFSWTQDDFNRRYIGDAAHKSPLFAAMQQFWNAKKSTDSCNAKMKDKKLEKDATELHTQDMNVKLATKKTFLESARKDLALMTDSLRISSHAQIIHDNIQDSTAFAQSLDSLTRKSAADTRAYKDLEEAAAGFAQQQTTAMAAVRKLLEEPQYKALKAKEFAPKFTGISFSTEDAKKLDAKLSTINIEAIKYEQYIVNSEQSGLAPLSFKMPSQADMIEALAIYLAKRVKQETVLWFFETLRKSAEANELIREGFPETVKLLEGGAIYETPNMGSAWRYALSKDFISFPQHAFESKWLQKYVPEGGQTILNDLRTGVTIARLLQQQYSYYDIVRYLYMEMSALPAGQPSMSKHIIDLLYGLQHELFLIDRKDSTSRGLTFEDFDRMNDSAFVMMLELVDLRYGKCVAGLTGWNSAERNLTVRDVQLLKTWIGKIQFTIRQIRQAREELNRAIATQGNTADPGNFTFTHYSVWKFFEELMKNALPDSSITAPGISVYRTSLRYLAQAQEVYELLEKKNYSGAIGSTFNILDALMEAATKGPASAKLLSAAFDGTKNDVPKSLRSSYEKFAADYNSLLSKNGLSGLINLVKTGTKDTDTLHFLENGKVLVDKIAQLGIKDTLFASRDALKAYIFSAMMRSGHLTKKADSTISAFSQNLMRQYRQEYYDVRQTALRMASFLNDVSLAGDSKQLARVIESYAMPPGSYKRKRNVWYSLDLNAFVGPYAGAELPATTFNQKATGVKGGGVWGLSAPIGISWSRTIGKKTNEETISKTGHLKNKRSGWYVPSKHTFSFTLSVIDIGAVVSYRFTNTESVRPQEFKWDQLVSPGIHAGWGIPGTPLVINTGFMFTPQLRRVEDITAETPTERQFNTFRFYGGLFFDIPMFNLWEKKSITRW